MDRLPIAAVRSSTIGPLTAVLRLSSRQFAWPGRILEQTQRSHLHSFEFHLWRSILDSYPPPLRSNFLPAEIQAGASSSLRSFHSGSRLTQEPDTKAKPETTKESAAEGESAKNTTEGSSEAGEGEGEGEKTKEEGEGKNKDKQEAPPPPPPHGDKSPWQVFTETLKTEFQSSKEWKESTKALSDGAQQFTENESVRRAREAYESTAGAVSSTTANVLKTTAGAVGKGAAWTWQTPVVKGVRTTVNATASVIEKGTRPIRETEAFKNVKNVIDDGSSSRYGGWVEKEERRKARELRELEEVKATGGRGRRVEVLKEDPE